MATKEQVQQEFGRRMKDEPDGRGNLWCLEVSNDGQRWWLVTADAPVWNSYYYRLRIRHMSRNPRRLKLFRTDFSRWSEMVEGTYGSVETMNVIEVIPEPEWRDWEPEPERTSIDDVTAEELRVPYQADSSSKLNSFQQQACVMLHVYQLPESERGKKWRLESRLANEMYASWVPVEGGVRWMLDNLEFRICEAVEVPSTIVWIKRPEPDEENGPFMTTQIETADWWIHSKGEGSVQSVTFPGKTEWRPVDSVAAVRSRMGA